MENGHNIRIVIADGQVMFRDGLRKLLNSEPGLEVVGEAGDGVEAVRAVCTLKPDLLLLEIAMPRRSGLETIRDLARSSPTTRLLLLLETIDRGQLIAALCAGARGLVMKSAAPHSLFKGIRTVMKGQYWLGRDRVPGLVEALMDRRRQRHAERPQGTFDLTPHEFRIIRAIAGGYTNKDIAQELALGETTVKHHLTTIFRKFHVSNRFELALLATHHHLVGDEAAPLHLPRNAKNSPARPWVE